MPSWDYVKKYDVNWFVTKAAFGSCKSISGKYSIFRKCYFSERKMFSCVWLHFKKCFRKYFLMFGCVLENTIENTFSTYCSHFLTFSRLPNEYIISFISQNTNKTQKKIIKFGQTKARSRSWSERSALRTIARRSTHRVKIEASIAIRATAPAGDVAIDSFFLPLSLSLSLSLSLFYFPRTEVIWSENRNGKSFPLFWISNSVNWKCFSVWLNLK